MPTLALVLLCAELWHLPALALAERKVATKPLSVSVVPFKAPQTRALGCLSLGLLFDITAKAVPSKSPPVLSVSAVPTRRVLQRRMVSSSTPTFECGSVNRTRLAVLARNANA